MIVSCPVGLMVKVIPPALRASGGLDQLAKYRLSIHQVSCIIYPLISLGVHSFFISTPLSFHFQFFFIFFHPISLHSFHSSPFPSPGRVYPSPLPPSQRFAGGGQPSPGTQKVVFLGTLILDHFLMLILINFGVFWSSFGGPFWHFLRSKPGTFF